MGVLVLNWFNNNLWKPFKTTAWSWIFSSFLSISLNLGLIRQDNYFHVFLLLPLQTTANIPMCHYDEYPVCRKAASSRSWISEPCCLFRYICCFCGKWIMATVSFLFPLVTCWKNCELYSLTLSCLKWRFYKFP